MSIAIEPRLETGADFIKLLHELGDIDPARVRMDPLPGTVTFDMFLNYMEEHEKPICEWVHHTIVEKAMGAHQSLLGYLIGLDIGKFAVPQLGLCYAEAGQLRVLPTSVRAADLAFVRWERFPGGIPPDETDRIPSVVPNLVVEVISNSNTDQEMERKRKEYFKAGVDVVWEVDPFTQTAREFVAVDDSTFIPTDGYLEGGTILPGYQLSLANLFGMLRGKPTTNEE